MFNAHSIRGKLSEFSATLHYCKPDIVCVTESWLFGKKPGLNHERGAFLDSELVSDQYKVYRNDRDEEGGGVFILVHKDIISIEETTLVTECELEWVKIRLKGAKDLYIGCFYMPKRNTEDLIQLDLSLSKLNQSSNKHKHIILCGDFNCPDILWASDKLKDDTHQQRHIQEQLMDLATDHNLTQLVDEPTRYSNVLDLCFTTNPSVIKDTKVIPGLSDHDAIVIDSTIRPIRQKITKKSVLQFSKAN